VARARGLSFTALVRWFLLVLLVIIIVGPFLILLSTALKTNAEVFKDPLGLPKVIRFTAFTTVIKDPRMLRYFLNSIIITVTTNVILTVLAVGASYAVARFTGWFGTALFGFFTMGMMIPTQVNMVPLYLLMSKIGLTNSYAGIIMVYIGFAMSFSVMVMSSFMRTLPASLLEAALLDGCGEGRTLMYIVAPLSMPSIATVVTFNFVWVWNDLFFPLMLLTRERMRTLPLGLLQYTGEYMSNYPVLFAGVLVAAVPMALVYMFMQRYFVEGLTAGAIKG